MQNFSAAFFAARHDGSVQALAKTFGHFVDLMGTVNLDSFAGSVEDDFAVAALVHVLLDLRAHLRGNVIVDQVVEKCQKFGAGHDAAPKIDGSKRASHGIVEIVRVVILPASFPLRPILSTPIFS